MLTQDGQRSALARALGRTLKQARKAKNSESRRCTLESLDENSLAILLSVILRTQNLIPRKNDSSIHLANLIVGCEELRYAEAVFFFESLDIDDPIDQRRHLARLGTKPLIVLLDLILGTYRLLPKSYGHKSEAEFFTHL